MDFPHVKIDYFKYGFKKGNKFLFNFFWFSLFLLGAYLIFTELNPFSLVLDIRAENQAVPTEIPLIPFSQKYLSVRQLLPAFVNFSFFVASPIDLPTTILLVLFLGISLGWSIIISAFSGMSKTAKIIISVVFLFFILSLKLPRLFMPELSTGLSYLYSSLIFLAFFLPLFFLERKKQPFALKFFLSVLLFLVLGSILYFTKNKAGLHFIIVHSFPVLTALLLFFLIFGSGTFILAYTWLAFQNPQKSKRFSFPAYVFPAFLISAFFLFQFLKHTRTLDIFLPEIPVSIPIFLMSVSFVFFFQPFFVGYKRVFQNNSNFSFGILGLGILSLSFLSFLFASGEKLFIDVTKTITWLVFTVGSVGTLMFVLKEFKDFIYGKVNFFYEIFRRATSSYLGVWFITLLLISGWEAYKERRELLITISAYSNQQADNYLLRGDFTSAEAFYNTATYYVPFDPKANYNLASLLIQRNEKVEYIIKRYKNATALFPFVPAQINLINVFIAREYYSQAVSFAEEMNSWQALVNGSFASYLNNQPQKAVELLQKASEENLNAPEIYLNLSSLYTLKHKYYFASKLIKEADLLAKQKTPAILTNKLALALVDSSVKIKKENLSSYENRYNYALYLYNNKDFENSIKITREIYRKDFKPDWGYMEILHASNLGKLDSLQKAISLYDQYEKLLLPYEKRILAHQLAGIFLSYDLPGSASEYFYKAAAFGEKQDSLHAIVTEILSGNHEEGLRKLTLYSLNHPDNLTRETERKLSGIVYGCYGDKESYYFYSPYYQNPSAEDCFLAGKIARQTKSVEIALDFLSKYVEKIDSTDPLPYFIVADIYYNIQDTNSAIDNLTWGYQRKPDSDTILAPLTLYHYETGHRQKASRYFRELRQKSPNSPWTNVAAAYVEQGKIDINKLSAPWKYNVVFNEYTARKLLENKRFEEGFSYFSSLTKIAPKNPYYWTWLAVFSLKINMPEDYAFCKEQALKFAKNPFFKKEIEKVFSRYDTEYKQALKNIEA